MKIVQVCTGYPPDRQGGVESIVRGLSLGLRGKGHEVHVVTRQWTKNVPDQFVIQVHTPREEAAGYVWWGIKSLRRIRTIRPDVVHCHGLEGAIVCILLRFSRVRKVFHLHNSLSREPTFYNSLVHKIGYRLLKEACASATAVVCPTEVVKTDLVKHLPSLDRRRVVVIPNMIEEYLPWPQEKIERLRFSLGLQSKRVILYFGKVKRTKGIEDICRAYHLLGDRRNLALVIGGSPTWTGTFFRRLREEYPDVIFTGYVEDPVPYYQMADIYCIYTDSFEGGETFAVSLAEAMSLGVPIVCSDNPIYREVTMNEAFFATPHDARQLSRALREALDDGQLAASRAASAKQMAKRRYSPQVFVSRLEGLYRQLVGDIDGLDLEHASSA